MGLRLYVGNLPYKATEEELKELFGRAGAVAGVQVMRDAMTGRARGFAFVEMATQVDADEAVKKLNNAELDGRALVVNEARPRLELGLRDSGGQSSRGPKSFRPNKGSRRGIRRAKRDRKAAW